MRRALILSLSACLAAACGDDEVIPATPDADVAPDAAPPDPLPPEAGGEYAVRVDTTSFDCASSDPDPIPPLYAVADIVTQDGRTMDLLSELQGTFMEYDRLDLARESDGSFQDRWDGYVGFYDIILTVTRDIEGSADGRSLDFTHRYDLGWDDDQGTYHSECVYEGEFHGLVLHERWDGSGKDGVTGQWRTERTVLADPRLERSLRLPRRFGGEEMDPRAHPAGAIVLFRAKRGGPWTMRIAASVPEPLHHKTTERRKAIRSAPEEDEAMADAMLMETEAEVPLQVRYVTLATLAQSPTDDIIDVRGVFRGMDRVYRDPQTGEIDAGMLIIAGYVDSDGNVRTMLQETVLTGTVLPTTLSLEETWRWWTAAKDALPEIEHWFQHERYEGTPRYMPHARAAPEPTHGTYAARYAMTANDCGYLPYEENRFLRILPVGGGAIWPRVTGFDLEPQVTPAPDGSFSAPFTRYTAFWRYEYALSGWLIGGHAVDLRMNVIRYDRATGAEDCSATFEIAGEKAFMTARD